MTPVSVLLLVSLLLPQNIQEIADGNSFNDAKLDLNHSIHHLMASTNHVIQLLTYSQTDQYFTGSLILFRKPENRQSSSHVFQLFTCPQTGGCCSSGVFISLSVVHQITISSLSLNSTSLYHEISVLNSSHQQSLYSSVTISEKRL